MENNAALEYIQAHIGKDKFHSPCEFTNWWNPKIIAADKGGLKVSFMVSSKMLNPAQQLHGGITAALMDDIIGATVFALGDKDPFTTLNNVIDYFYAGRENDNLLLITKVIKKGRQIVNVQCELWNETETKILARGYSNLIRLEKR
jgi:uncharacterized protein (TIGR00369 family)